MDLAPLIRNVPDFPKPGIQFKDITTLLKNARAFQYVIDTWKCRYLEQNIQAIVGADARGFIFGAALAYAMHLPFIPVRKHGKLPAKTINGSFELEYGVDSVEIHVDALAPGQRVVLIDDLLATGGTMAATVALVKSLGAIIVEVSFLIELTALKGRDKLGDVPVHSFIQFEE